MMHLSQKQLMQWRDRLNWEWILPGLGAAVLLVSCITISAKKTFWNDELYSYFFLADPSFSHMMTAFQDTINNTPPLYFILGWLWARVFGASELSLRLFSSIGMGIACWITWITLRATYSFWATSIATLMVFCTSSLILAQNAEARMYGLFLAVAALVLFLFDRLNRTPRSRLLRVANFCTHAALVNIHLFGLFYSGAVLVAWLIRDRWFKVFRPRIYLSIGLAWLALIPYIPAFLNQSDAGKPRSWLPVPYISDLLSFLVYPSPPFIQPGFLFILLLIPGLQLLLGQLNKTQERDRYSISDPNLPLQAELSLLLFAFAFLAVPVFVWLVSRTIKPIFYDRYLIPSSLSWVIFLAYVSARLLVDFPATQFRSAKQATVQLWQKIGSGLPLVGLTVLLLLYPIANAREVFAQVRVSDDRYGYTNLPIVAQMSAKFMERFHYSTEPNRYFFILDWQSAVDPASGLFGPQEYKHMEAWKRSYPQLFQNQVLTSEEFLSRYDQFLVLEYGEFNRSCPTTVKGLEVTYDGFDILCP